MPHLEPTMANARVIDDKIAHRALLGSILDIDESRKLVPHQNATTLQVACSVVAAIKWMIANPNKGICLPEDLPHEEILSLAVNYLGSFISASMMSRVSRIAKNNN